MTDLSSIFFLFTRLVYRKIRDYSGKAIPSHTHRMTTKGKSQEHIGYGDLFLSSVSFFYPGYKHYILSGVSLALPIPPKKRGIHDVSYLFRTSNSGISSCSRVCGGKSLRLQACDSPPFFPSQGMPNRLNRGGAFPLYCCCHSTHSQRQASRNHTWSEYNSPTPGHQWLSKVCWRDPNQTVPKADSITPFNVTQTRRDKYLD